MSTQIAALPRKKAGKALWRVDDGSLKELLISCPGCKALEVIRFDGQAMVPTRKFTQKAGRVYHDCGSIQPCRLHVSHGADVLQAGSRIAPVAIQRHITRGRRRVSDTRR